MRFGLKAAVAAGVLMVAGNAGAREFYVGGPVTQHDMEITAAYLVGIEMAPMPKTMVHGPDVVHLEADVHATADNAQGYPDGSWVPYLTIDYDIVKANSAWHAKGTLLPMVARDGPHYANDIKLEGPGKYSVTYRFTSPESNGFYRHVDKETEVAAWWAPFSETFSFAYPQQSGVALP